MINIGIALLVMVMSFQCFTITYRLNGINRTLMEIPLSIFEVAVPLAQENDEIVIYFDQEYLINELTYYFDNKLPFYTSNYDLNYYFSNTGETSMCIEGNCSAIEISLDAEVVFFTRYQKTARYEIREGRHGQ